MQTGWRHLGLVEGPIVAWAVLIASAPWLADAGRAGQIVAGLAYLAGSMVCHQIADRSFHLSGHQLPVCARCSGLYAGAAVGVVLWRWLRRPALAHLDAPRLAAWARAVVVISATPTVVSLTMAALSWWDPANDVRFAGAIPLGAAAGAVVAAVVAGDLR